MNLFLLVLNNSGLRAKCFILKIEGCKIKKDDRPPTTDYRPRTADYRRRTTDHGRKTIHNIIQNVLTTMPASSKFQVCGPLSVVRGHSSCGLWSVVCRRSYGCRWSVVRRLSSCRRWSVVCRRSSYRRWSVVCHHSSRCRWSIVRRRSSALTTVYHLHIPKIEGILRKSTSF